MSLDTSSAGSQRRTTRLIAGALACTATLMAIPGHAAVVLPDVPLQVGSAVPPNIMFILDDSGSMALETMPNPDLSTVCRRSGSGCASCSIIV